MSKISKRKMIIYSLLFILISGLLVLSLCLVSKFNKKEHNEQLSATQMELKQISDGLDIKFSVSRDDHWDKIISDETLIDPEEANYVANFYSIEATNNSKNLMDYKVTIAPNKQMYVYKAWSGKVEFHQIRSGKEIVATLDMCDEKPDSNAVSIEYYQHDATDPKEYSVLLRPGDYMVYLPTKSKGKETPLPPGTNTDGTNYSIPEMIIYESKAGVTSYTATGSYPIEEKDESTKSLDIDLTIASRNDSWGKAIEYKSETINCVAETYDFTFTNQSKYKISNYNFKFIADKRVFLDKGWNGSFEIHQFINGTEIIEKIDDLRNYTANDYELLFDDSRTLILLNEGDYFIYTPSKDWREAPLDKNGKATPGIIIYHDQQDNISTFKAEISYNFEKRLMKYPPFVIAIILFTLYFIIIIVEIAIALRVKKYEERAKHDEAMIIEAIKTFTGFIDAKDKYTNGHSNRVAFYAKLLAKKAGYSEDEQKRLYFIGLMHDCGKIGIPDSILTKPDKLTPEEIKIIRTHTTVGYEILKDFKSIPGIRNGVLYHHEKYNGSGYPKGLSGNDIPLDARIICVADAFDAMNSDRCYRPRLTRDAILKEFKDCKGTHFDPTICQIMIDMIESGEIRFER